MNMIKRLTFVACVSLMLAACSKTPKPFEVRDICSQPEGSAVIVQGFLSLPKTIDTIQLTKGGKITQVGYQLPLSTKPDAAGEMVKTTIWTTNSKEPNKIKAVPNGAFTANDLLVYAENGTEITAGKTVKLTGETVKDEKSGCAITVTKVEAL